MLPERSWRHRLAFLDRDAGVMVGAPAAPSREREQTIRERAVVMMTTGRLPSLPLVIALSGGSAPATRHAVQDAGLTRRGTAGESFHAIPIAESVVRSTGRCPGSAYVTASVEWRSERMSAPCVPRKAGKSADRLEMLVSLAEQVW